MATKRFNYKPIFPGFPWSIVLNLQASPAMFPLASTWKAQVRTAPGATVLATLTTENGKLARLDDNRMQVSLAATDSVRGWEEGDVMFDLVRTDVDPDQHTGIRVTAKVKLSVTAR